MNGRGPDMSYSLEYETRSMLQEAQRQMRRHLREGHTWMAVGCLETMELANETREDCGLDAIPYAVPSELRGVRL